MSDHNMNEPLTRSQFKIKLREIVEKHNNDLTGENFGEELFDIIKNERVKARSFSDPCDGEWENFNVHAPENKDND